MVFRREFIVNEGTESSDSQTKIINLPEAGNISALIIRFAATNGSTSNKDNEIWRVVSKIEVIGDGSDVIYSLTGQEAFRHTWYWLKRPPAMNIDETPSEVQFCDFVILFGRYIGDPDFKLPLNKWKKVDLRITYNLAAVRAVGATGYVSGSTVITVIAYREIGAEATASKGWRRTTEIETFTSAASGEKRIELPTRHEAIGFGVYCFESGVADDTDITEVKFELENGAIIQHSANWNDLQEENSMYRGVYTLMRGRAFKSDTDTIETWTGRSNGSYFIWPEVDQNITADTMVLPAPSAFTAGQITLNEAQGDWTAGAEDLTAYTTDDTHFWLADSGYIAHWVYQPLDPTPDWSKPFDLRKFSKAEVVLTQGGAGATVGVVLDELVR